MNYFEFELLRIISFFMKSNFISFDSFEDGFKTIKQVFFFCCEFLEIGSGNERNSTLKKKSTSILIKASSFKRNLLHINPINFESKRN